MNDKIKYLVRAACVAAIYAVLTVVTQPISFGAMQLRVSEALTLLPFLFPEAVWGVTIGCLIANLLGGTILDVIFGTLATLLAAIATKKMKSIWLAPLPPVLFNALIVGAVIAFNTYAEPTLALVATTCLMIGASQAIVCYIIGIPFMALVNKMKFLFK